MTGPHILQRISGFPISALSLRRAFCNINNRNFARIVGRGRCGLRFQLSVFQISALPSGYVKEPSASSVGRGPLPKVYYSNISANFFGNYFGPGWSHRFSSPTSHPLDSCMQLQFWRQCSGLRQPSLTLPTNFCDFIRISFRIENLERLAKDRESIENQRPTLLPRV
jgi:hypothetical protein